MSKVPHTTNIGKNTRQTEHCKHRGKHTAKVQHTTLFEKAHRKKIYHGKHLGHVVVATIDGVVTTIGLCCVSPNRDTSKICATSPHFLHARCGVPNVLFPRAHSFPSLIFLFPYMYTEKDPLSSVCGNTVGKQPFPIVSSPPSFSTIFEPDYPHI
jgi:hypothetical protein